jgi:glyoxylase-like metal-dependent hydrolase (beta-lactamase superfamily II)
MTPIELHHLNCGTMCPRGARLVVGRGGLRDTARQVAHCLLIEAGSELVLVDTGFGLDDCASPGRLGRGFRALARPVTEPAETAIRQIEALGRDPADVRHIVVTHLDLDHAGGLADFPDAEVHVFASELAAAQNPPRREALRYVKKQWAHGPNWETYGVGGDRWYDFESIRLLPDLDADVALIPLPGHSTGHCGVAVNTSDGWLLHCGDSFFHHGEIKTPPHAPPAIRFHQNLNQHDGKARNRNQERLRELNREHGDEVSLICSHDPEMM